MSRTRLLGVDIDSITMDEALKRIEALIAQRKPSYVVTPNADVMVTLQRDKEFKRIYDGASLVLVDGMSLVWAGMLLGKPFAEKVSGSDLFTAFCKLAAEKGYTVYFMGAMPGVAAKAAEVLQQRYPGLKVVGTHSPSFGFEKNAEESEDVARRIREAAPDVLFLGLGSPKQEKWTDRYIQKHGAPVSIMVGISFDYVAGTVKRAPVWMQHAGFEWFWRLLMEPKRLWKRYLVTDPKFFWYVFMQKWGRN